MNVREETDGALVLTYDNSLWTKWLIGATLVLLATAGYDLWLGPRGTDRLIGLLGGAATCALAGLVMLEKVWFRVDPAKQIIVWDRRWGLRRRTGTTAFAEVRSVMVEIPIGDDGIPSRRICLHLADGTLLPITVGYAPDVGDRIVHLADKLRKVLGHAAPSPADSARTLVEMGRAVDAVRLLVEKEGLSLTAAKQRVDEMRKV